MSWNLYLEKPKCPNCGHNGTIYSSDYTSNMRPMLNFAGFDWEQLDDLDMVRGLKYLNSFIDKLENYPEVYKPLNPSNGWGDYDSFLVMLKELRQAWVQNPTSIFRHTR
jgi:hypothetical protein